jgi:hypothetical protein
MLVALIALAVAFNFTDSSSDDDDGDDDGSKSVGTTQVISSLLSLSFLLLFPFPQVIILASMFIYIGGYQIGFGPIAWLLISEVFPLEVRGQAVAVAVQTNFFWNVITSYLFPIATSAIGLPFPPPHLSFRYFLIPSQEPRRHLESLQSSMRLLCISSSNLFQRPKAYLWKILRFC